MAAKKTEEIAVMEVRTGELEVCILGTSPIILNRMSNKALHELLLPKGRKTAADKAANLKHDPFTEYRDAPYTAKGDDAETRLQLLASMFKGALRNAALDMPGAKKAQIGRLTWINGDRLSLWGIPQIMMSVTRSADMNRTPDVRTRAILPSWACRVSVSYVEPIINQKILGNLLAAAGLYIGIGDYRPEKGAGNYGQFRLVGPDDPEFVHLTKLEGREAQDNALMNPECYDDETETLLAWFRDEAGRRGLKVAA